MREAKYSYSDCEAPQHIPDCSGRGSTKDHFTPKCVAKINGWTRTRVNSLNNLQYLSPECHGEKDRDTALRKEVLLQQLAGSQRWSTFESHLATFLGDEYVMRYKLLTDK